MNIKSTKISRLIALLVGVVVIPYTILSCKRESKKLIGERDAYDHVTKISFKEETHKFGDVNQGDTVSHFFVFRNTGHSDLKIEDVSSSCGCTIPTWPKSEIKPGNVDSIRVVFSKNNEAGFHSRAVIVRSNTNPEYNQIYISANVLPSNKFQISKLSNK